MNKRNRIAKMTERGIMVDTKELHKLGPVDGAIAMFADLLGDIVDDDLPSKEKETK